MGALHFSLALMTCATLLSGAPARAADAPRSYVADPDVYRVVTREAGVEAETSMKAIDGLGLRVQDAIEEAAARWPADLIVLGTHGRRGFRRMLLGSVAEGVARIATKPVLLIRGK